ncbi:30S ribosomal protein S9 [Candidatus Kaiserbacteria bacterium RIFCSPHIGHO2_01_FULL_49_13]|uniref:Small ribosomal subunit protein uS9 n=1 Tax=Candidatus Kaiserbacteria bacterium RIFCSPHIGHO2_01_FULL_49_13 TaxID=1798477 RepID=A0A1F6CCJ0_9BACT|nr:MAG: 30S ribosomal protein S9 [Candidatus Kaiserbacteria bacterium RIFCSPHIGHO2_01_FULL_49_13]
MADSRYIEAVGRRKTAIARVRISESAKTSVTINNRELSSYFATDDLRRTATEPLSRGVSGHFKITAVIRGGGTSGQAEALRHGISRALVEYDARLRGELKKAGFLKRDPRSKERRKFGLKKARKAPQWSKR